MGDILAETGKIGIQNIVGRVSIGPKEKKKRRK